MALMGGPGNTIRFYKHLPRKRSSHLTLDRHRKLPAPTDLPARYGLLSPPSSPARTKHQRSGAKDAKARERREEEEWLQKLPIKLPHHKIQMKILDNQARIGASPIYIQALKDLLRGENDKLTHKNGQSTLPLLSQDRFSQVEASRESVPAYLFRTYSTGNGERRYVRHKKTNGGNFAHMFEPAADQNRAQGWSCQPSVGQMPVGPTKYMIGMHLLWRDLEFDQFLSWTTSLLFAIEHALGRRARGETGIKIAMIDTRKAYSYVDGKRVPAAFYPALDLCDAFDVHERRGWGDQRSQDLRPRCFTHELLSTGTVYVDENEMSHISLQDDVINKGFFEVFPEFQVDASYEPSKLYTRLVALRKTLFPAVASEELPYEPLYSYTDATPVWPITQRTLEVCSDIAKAFIASPEQGQESAVKAPLHAFLSLLAMQNRKREEDAFMTWIRSHGYTVEDVEDIVLADTSREYRKDLTFAYDNLPEQLQYLDLLRDASAALGMDRLPRNRVSTLHFATRCHYKREESRMQGIELFAPLSSKELTKWANRAQARGLSDGASKLHERARARKEAEAQARALRKAIGGGKQSAAGLLTNTAAQEELGGTPSSDGEIESFSEDAGDSSEEESELEDDMTAEEIAAHSEQNERAVESMSS